MINGYFYVFNTSFFVISTGIPFRTRKVKILEGCMLHLSPVCIFKSQDYVGPLSILYAALLL